MMMQENLNLLKNIKEKGLKKEYKKHVSYFYKLYRIGTITVNEFLKSQESILTTLGR